MKHELAPNQIGTQATDTVKAVWPEFDIFGGRYDKAAVTVVHLKGTKEFAVVPGGREFGELVRKPAAKKGGSDVPGGN